MSPVENRGSSNEKPASRRERGVLAQRAYRKRHASKFQNLKEENERLREAIKRIGLVAAGEGRFNSDLDSAIALAKNVAGPGDDDSDLAGQRNGASNQAELTNCRRINSQETSPTPQVSPKTWSNTPSSQNIPTSSGIFVDGSMRMRNFAIPSNCTTYLGDTRSESLAAGIYRSVLSIAIKRWHDHFQRESRSQTPDRPARNHSSSTSFSLQGATNSVPPNALDIAFPLLHPPVGDDVVPRCIFSRPPSEQPSDASPTCAHEVVKPCRINEPQGWWRASDGLEAFLRQQVLPPEAIAIFEEVMRGGGTKQQADDVQSMLEGLARNYKCFGDGPRWNAVYVTVAMDMFRKDIMGECYPSAHDE